MKPTSRNGNAMGSTILVVEDEVKIRELLRLYFEREGLEVVSTGSGADAIGLTQTAAPDLVVLDLRLPDVPGESVASEIRRFSSVPILMLTAKAAERDRIHGLELGADDYVTKPLVHARSSFGRRPSSAGDMQAGWKAGMRPSAVVSWSSTRPGGSPTFGGSGSN